MSLLTGNFQTYSLGDYTLANNDWFAVGVGLVNGTDFTQQISYNPSNITSDVVMSWNYPGVQPTDYVYGYPEIVWGGQYGGIGPGTTALATQVSNINSLIVNYSTSLSGDTTKFDVGIEIWTTNVSPTQAGVTITNEIMVKVHGPTADGLTDGPGTTVENSQLGISGGGTSIEAFHAETEASGSPGTFVTIDTTADVLTGSINFATILNSLVAQGIVNSNNYVSGVELGSEMELGSGSLTVNSFSVTENNTTTIPATSVQQEIAGLYVTLYGLAATQAGITYWTNVVSAFDPSITAGNAGATAISLNDQVYLGQQMTAGSLVVNGTIYFQTLYPTTMTDQAYVQALYQNMSGFIGTVAGDQYWLNLLQQAEAGNGGNITLAREAIVGRLAHDLYSDNLTVGATALGVSASDYALLVAGQQTLQNKVTVAQYWATETGVTGGSILAFAHVTDPSFAAAQHVLAGITSDPSTVTVAITGIAAAVAQQNLSLV